ncbi:MAG: rhomboid family intramembrane serine protease [Candidatus Brocadiia bacterium]
MFLLVPYRVDVPLYRRPIANYVILALLVVCYIIEQTQMPFGAVSLSEAPAIAPFVLNGWNPLGLIGHIFLHGGIFHLAGNLIFLWVFGNAVCEKVGNAAYPFLFVGMGIVAGMAHVLFSGHPAIGASGAISGVMAMCLVWYPTNELSCFYFAWLLFFIRFGWFEVSSYWIMLLGLAFDVLGVALGLGGVAYWAHIGGFAARLALAIALMQRRWVSMDDTERTLLDIFGLRTAWRDRVARSALEAATAGSTAVRYPAPPGNPMPIPQEDTIPVVCACGKLLKAKREFAGRRGRCPACLAPIRIPQE